MRAFALSDDTCAARSAGEQSHHRVGDCFPKARKDMTLFIMLPAEQTLCFTRIKKNFYYHSRSASARVHQGKNFSFSSSEGISVTVSGAAM
jgi:hypothetical protein